MDHDMNVVDLDGSTAYEEIASRSRSAQRSPQPANLHPFDNTATNSSVELDTDDDDGYADTPIQRAPPDTAATDDDEVDTASSGDGDMQLIAVESYTADSESLPNGSTKEQPVAEQNGERSKSKTQPPPISTASTNDKSTHEADAASKSSVITPTSVVLQTSSKDGSQSPQSTLRSPSGPSPTSRGGGAGPSFASSDVTNDSLTNGSIGQMSRVRRRSVVEDIAAYSCVSSEVPILKVKKDPRISETDDVEEEKKEGQDDQNYSVALTSANLDGLQRREKLKVLRAVKNDRALSEASSCSGAAYPLGFSTNEKNGGKHRFGSEAGSSLIALERTVVREDPDRPGHWEVDEIQIGEGDVVQFIWGPGAIDRGPTPRIHPNEPAAFSSQPTSLNQSSKNADDDDDDVAVEDLDPDPVGPQTTNIFSESSGVKQPADEPLLAHAIMEVETEFSNEPWDNMLARKSGSPREEGEFLCRFGEAGEFFFCSKTYPDMLRLKVVVTSKEDPRQIRMLLIRNVIVGLLCLGTLAVTVAMVTLWSQKQGIALGAINDVPELERDFIRYSFPWYVVGMLFASLLLVAGFLVQFRTRYLSNYGRGYPEKQHHTISLIALVFLIAIGGLIYGCWGWTLAVAEGLALFAKALGRGIDLALSDVLTTLDDTQFLARELPVLIPGFVVPPSASVTIGDVEDIVLDVRGWARSGEDLLRAAFRTFSILTFMSLQMVLLAAVMGLVATFQRKSKLMRAAAWALCVGATAMAFALGTNWLLYRIMVISNDAAKAFASRDISVNSISDRASVDKDSPILKVLSLCTNDRDAISFDFVAQSMEAGVEKLNNDLEAQGYPQLATFLAPQQVIDVTVDQLSNYTDYLALQLQLAEDIITSNSTTLPVVNSTAIPALKASLSVAGSMFRIVDCSLLRETLTEALGVVETRVIHPLAQQLNIKMATFALLLATAIVATVAATVYARPLKRFFEPRTKRWFMFRGSLIVHQRVLTRRAHAGMRPDDKYSPPICEKLGVLETINDLNVVNAIMVFLQAFLILLVHINADKEHERLSALLIAVAALCIAKPLFTIPIGIIKRYQFQRALRVVAFTINTATLVLILVYTITTGLETSDCIDEIKEIRSSRNTTDTISYNSEDDCNADRVAAKVERSIYAAFIGVICLLAFLSGGTLFVYARIAIHVQYYIPGAATAKAAFRSLRRFAAKRVTTKVIVAVAFFLAVGVTLGIVLPIVLRSDPRDMCNGNADFCDRPINKIGFPTSHNAYSSSADRYVAANHYVSLDTQIHTGARGIMLDVIPDELGNPALCHKYCQLGRKPFNESLLSLASHMDNNPRDVFFLLLEQYSETQDVLDVFNETGLYERAWIPFNRTSPQWDEEFVWPTPQQLIDNNTRLLIFTDVEPNANKTAFPPWFLYMWDYFYETPFTFSDETQFSCDAFRGVTQDSILARKMHVMNHFLTLGTPLPALAAEVNSRSSIVNRGKECSSRWGRPTNMITIDFWALGSIGEATNDLNSWFLENYN